MPISVPYPAGVRLGADLSRWQGDIDAGKMVADGIEIVALRLSVGDFYTDRTYEFYYDMFKAAGIPVVAYVVTYPSISVRGHIDRLEASLAGRLPDGWVVDAEIDDGVPIPQITECNMGLADYMSYTYNKPTGFYSRKSWWDVHMAPKTYLKCVTQGYFSWMAHYYYPSVQSPLIVSGWPNDVWQWTNKGQIDGCKENIDLDWFSERLYQEIKGGSPPASKPVVRVTYDESQIEVVLEK